MLNANRMSQLRNASIFWWPEYMSAFCNHSTPTPFQYFFALFALLKKSIYIWILGEFKFAFRQFNTILTNIIMYYSYIKYYKYSKNSQFSKTYPICYTGLWTGSRNENKIRKQIKFWQEQNQNQKRNQISISNFDFLIPKRIKKLKWPLTG